MLSFIEQHEYGLLLRIKAIPKSSKNHFGGVINNRIKIHITVAPEKGKANQQIIDFLSKQLKVSKSSIKIINGTTTQTKDITISVQSDYIPKIISLLDEKAH